MPTDSRSGLPALCAEMKLRDDGAVALVNSRDVAEAFEKDHKHVLRDIKALDIGPDLGRSWFRETTSPDAYGRPQPSVDMTRDGFTILAMGWTGERAMSFKVRYISAFNAMETELKARAPNDTDKFLAAVREIVAPLGVRFEGQDRAIDRLESKVGAVALDVAFLKANALKGRRNLTAATKQAHVDDTSALGGRCPCCGVSEVTAQSEKSRFAEFGHFYENSKPDVAHTWLICKPCHSELTAGRVDRHGREAEFRAYQDKRRRLPGRQPSLFG